MAKLSVYEPPMCCSTGVCGPDGEDHLAQFASTLDWAKRSGHDVERYDLGHSPGAFAGNAFVRGMIETEGMGVLPLVLVDGEILIKGGYPSRDAVAGRLAGTSTAQCCAPAPADTKAASDTCCAPLTADASAGKTTGDQACCAPAAASASAKSTCC